MADSLKDELKKLRTITSDLKKNAKEFRPSSSSSSTKNSFLSTGQKVEDLIFGSLNSTKRQRKADVIKTKYKEKPMIMAPNIIEWVINSQYMNSPGSIEFRRCMQVLHQLYELICPRCEWDLFTTPDKMWDMTPIQIQNVHRLEHGICPKCGVTRSELRHEGLINDIHEMIGVAGMRSGKSLLTGGIIGTYQLHQALCYDDIQKFLGGMIERQRLTMTFIATSGKQAAGTVWEYFNNAFDSSPWFNDYVNYLKDLEKTLPEFNHGDLYKRNSGEIYFKNKNIYCDSANSNSGSLAGATRLLSVIDEFAKFDFTSDSLRGADEVYRMMKKSLQTVRSRNREKIELGQLECITGILATCSSPISEHDKLMQQYRNAKKHKKVFAFKYATWEFNPTVTREDLAETFEEDYIGAMRDFGAAPPGASSPYIKNMERIDSAQDIGRKPIFTMNSYNRDAQLPDGSVAKFIAAGITNCGFNKEDIHVIALDPGLSNHGFGISILHLEQSAIFRVIVDGVIEILPTLNQKTGEIDREVDFLCIVPMIQAMCKQLNVRCVTFDRWNSETMIQELQSKGIPTKKKNTAYTMYEDFRRDLNTGNIRFIQSEIPRAEWGFKMRGLPYAKVLLELLTLDDDGKKIRPSKGGSDDLIQTIVRGSAILREIFSERNFQGRPTAKKKYDGADRQYMLNNAQPSAFRGTITTHQQNNPMLGDMRNADLIPKGFTEGLFLNSRSQNDSTKVISMHQQGMASAVPYRKKISKMKPGMI